MILNKEQNIIINYFTGDTERKRVLVVEAPPGTGKTYTAVATAIRYIKNEVRKNSRYNKKILILTFSKNARAQIVKQLEELDMGTKKVSNYIEVSNYHSFFQKYVWAYSSFLGLGNNLMIMSPKQRKVKLEEYLHNIKEYDKSAEQYNWLESLLEGEFYTYTPKGNIKPAIKKLMPFKDEIIGYIKKLNSNGLIGFSDMGYYMNRLLDKSPALLEIIQNKYPLIISDEYQDASDLQDKIVKKLVGKNNNALFFADSKQMIYGWRGASSSRIDDLFKVYKDEIEKKELKVSMRFKNKKDIESTLNLLRKGKYDINGFTSSDNVTYKKIYLEEKNQYSKQIKNKMYSKLKYELIKTLPKATERREKSIGILCRSNDLVKYIKKALRDEFKITSQVIGNNEEEHNIVADLIEFNNMKEQGISIDNLTKEVFKYIFNSIYDENIGSIKRNKLMNISYSNLKNVRLSFLKDVAAYIKVAYESGEYFSCIFKCLNLIKDSDYKINYGNFSLIRTIVLMKENSVDKITDIFLQYQYLKSFKELKGIYVLTVHQSKGREFDYVFVVDRETLNKEENLLYVAFSRVKEKLIIFDWLLNE